MEGEQVKVKWGREWFPATILCHINEEKVKVMFEDPEYPSEIVLGSNIRPLDASLNPVSVKLIAGAFDWQVFKSFCKDIIGDSAFVTALSAQELKDLDLKASLLSAHAIERMEERYRKNMQEFVRSLSTDQYFAFRETRRRVFSDNMRIDCTPDLKTVLSLQTSRKEPESAVVRTYLENDDIGHLRNAVEAWNLRRARDALSLDIESYTDHGEVVTTQVVTTTTRFVLSADYSRVVTVIKLDTSFGEWRKHYDRDQKRSSRLQHSKCGY